MTFRCAMLASVIRSDALAAGEAERGLLFNACPVRTALLVINAGAPRVLNTYDLLGRTVGCVSPRFPPYGRQLRVEGYVPVGILVNESGNVARARALGGHHLVIPSALEAATQWIFRGATQNGHAASFYGILTFHFSTSGLEKAGASCLSAHW